MSDTFGKGVILMSDTKTMGAGRREDLKAIWGEVSQFNAMQWEVDGYVYLGSPRKLLGRRLVGGGVGG